MSVHYIVNRKTHSSHKHPGEPATNMSVTKVKHMANDVLIVLETTVADLLKSDPSAVNFFIRQQTACVGCYLAKFCTLTEVIKVYQLDEKQFLEELARFLVHKT